MNQDDPNITIVAQVLDELGSLKDSLVLVGGCAVGLLITDTARAPVRETIDVDMVTQVASLAGYYNVADQLRARGFKETAAAAHFCRWTKGTLILDVLPSDENVLGHSTNRWYPLVVDTSIELVLPTGQNVKVISPPLFIATKLEAFANRGQENYLQHDMEDIINVIDGRIELQNEIRDCAQEVHAFIKEEFESIVINERFIDMLPGHFAGDAISQIRKDIVYDRMRQIAGY